jgi:signal transduction histidine kinase/CheY-like chemotaxis protein
MTNATVPRMTLARRFARQIALVSMLLLLAAGGTEGYFSYQEAREQIARAQAVQAQAAAGEIQQYLQAVARSLTQVQMLPWGQPDFGALQRRQELHRLLSLNPAIVEVQDVNAQGHETLFVSRRVPDRLNSGVDALLPAATVSQASAATWGEPFFDDQGVPNVCLGIAASHSTSPTLASTAVINLRFLADVVSGLRSRDGGEVYVVDGSQHLIAHPDPTLLLKQLDLREHAPAAQARRAFMAGAASLQAVDAPGLRGGNAITSAVALQSPAWLVFVEQPRAQALEPALATLTRTALLLAAAGLLAWAVSVISARRMAAPITRLREATAELAAGRLGGQLQVRTGDEIEGLAGDFNVMSAQLAQSYSELEDKVAHRTAELAERRDEAERANAAKTRFLASASHDLRQPMHAIGLLVGMMRERLAQPDLRDLADKTHQAVQTMEGLFGSLLDISQLDAGAIRPKPEVFALQSLFERAALVYAPLAAAKGLALRVRPTREQVHTDPAMLERMIGNLLTNAIRYTHSGGVLIGCRRQAQRLLIQVFDTGIGVAARQYSIIFEEFVRLDEGGAQDRGLGLGLSIVKRTADLLGVGIGVLSQPGRGSRFELSLARLPASVAGGIVATTVLPDDRSFAGAFVLVVDDDPINREVTGALLAQWGCLVATAANAEQAMQELARHLRAPDAIVTDFSLGPGANGIELTRQVRAQGVEVIPALVVTADVAVTPGTEPAMQVLHKPVDAQRLRAELLALLATAPAA